MAEAPRIPLPTELPDSPFSVGNSQNQHLGKERLARNPSCIRESENLCICFLTLTEKSSVTLLCRLSKVCFPGPRRAKSLP